VGDFAEQADQAEHDEEITRLHREIDRLEERVILLGAERDRAKASQKRLIVEKGEAESRLHEALSVEQANKKIPKWTVPPRSKRKRHGTPTIFLSDTHWSEVVNPAEVSHYNAYSTDIATQRLERLLVNAVKVTDMVDLTYDGIVVPFGGDMFSGLIHRELDRTNDMTDEEAVIYWTEQCVAFLLALADHFGKVHVPAFVGNHGRSAMDRRMPGKQRAKTNKDWLLYKNIAMVLARDSRITFQISEGMDVLYDVYDTTYLGYHGNDFSGGSGISGIFTPVMLGKHRTEAQYKAFGKTFHYMHIGHFHQHIEAKGLIVNGSLKGYDEFAYSKRYHPERPSQAMWITTPENGLTFSMPVWVDDADAEGWGEVQEVAR
jgi:hypothetical protein